MVVRLGSTNVKAARDDEELSSAVAEVTGLTAGAVEAALQGAHGRTRLDTLFADSWPWTAAGFSGATVAWARELGLDEELSRVTGLTTRTVRGRLKKVAGQMLVANLFAEDWPDDDADELAGVRAGGVDPRLCRRGGAERHRRFRQGGVAGTGLAVGEVGVLDVDGVGLPHDRSGWHLCGC